MAVDSLVGQDVIDLANGRLSGYANAVSQDDLLGFLNEAKDSVWNILKNLEDEYFITPSQATNAAGSYYFPALNATTREYALPTDLREIKFIECLTPGFTGLTFAFRNLTDGDFRSLRRGANDGTTAITNNPETILYTVVGKKTIVFADYPPAALTLQIWYVRSIPDFEAADPVDEVLYPYSKKIASYAAKAIMLATQDATQFQMWSAKWREDVIEIAQGADGRNGSDPVFVEGLCEGDD